MQWRVGTGDRIKFWEDVRTDEGQLKDYALNPNDVCDNQKVEDFSKPYRWKQEVLLKVLPREIVIKILPIYASKDSSLEDRKIWGPSKNGNFSIKSAYNLKMTGNNNNTTWSGDIYGNWMWPQR